MSRKGNPYDNAKAKAKAESFMKTLSTKKF
jgi:transposase InsO family protein